jgi:predicted PurR-regulated permease PerM
VIIILLVTIPSLFLVNTLSREGYILYNLGQQKLGSGSLFICESEGFMCNIQMYFSDAKTRFYIQEAWDNVTNSMISSFSNFALSIPNLVLELFMVLFVLFYLFVQVDELKDKILRVFPGHVKFMNSVIQNLSDVTYSVVYGMFIIGVIDFLLSTLAFVIIGVSSPVLWGLVVGFLIFIPFLGPSAVLIPMVILEVITGIWWKVAVLGAVSLAIFAIDTFLRSVIVGDSLDLNPVFVLIGIFGGLHLLGLPGIVIGPLIMSFFTVLINQFEKKGSFI